MNATKKLMQFYFNYAYNPVYDFTIGRLNRYQILQKTCIGKFKFRDNDRVLCVGVGTGNEILHILQLNMNIRITGVDYSYTALQKASEKALRLGKEIEVIIMDARHLEFATGSFDKVLCLHVMDFIKEDGESTSEILRVLKDGGQFVITFPSGKEGAKLGVNLLKDSISNIDSRNRFKALSTLIPQMLVGTVYLPLLFRPNRKSYTRSKLETLISKLTTQFFHIEEDPVYQDFIVYGEK